MKLEHQIGLLVTPVSIRQFYCLTYLFEDAYIYKEGHYLKIFDAEKSINTKEIDKLSIQGILVIYVGAKDFLEIKTKLYANLQEATRKLSIGDAIVSGQDYVSSLLENLALLYEDYHDQGLLALIYHTAPSFCQYLQNNKKNIGTLYKHVIKSNQQYIFKQPILSSLFLAMYLAENNLFNPKEAQDIFVLSLLKDIGMCFVPRHSWNKKVLDPYEQEALSLHAINSVQLLKDRIPIHPTGLQIIEHHHFQNDSVRNFLQNKKMEQDQQLIHGIETAIIALTDLIVAMNTHRPYRKTYPISVIKKVVSLIMKDLYPIEEKSLIKFVDFFFLDYLNS